MISSGQSAVQQSGSKVITTASEAQWANSWSIVTTPLSSSCWPIPTSVEVSKQNTTLIVSHRSMEQKSSTSNITILITIHLSSCILLNNLIDKSSSSPSSDVKVVQLADIPKGPAGGGEKLMQLQNQFSIFNQINIDSIWCSSRRRWISQKEGFWGSRPISAFVFCPPFGFECWAPVIREEFDPGREEWEIDKAKAFGRTHDWNLTGQYRRMVTLEYPAYLVDFTRREEMRITKEEEESQSGSKVGTCALLAPQSAIFPSLSSRERFIQRWLLSVHRWCSWLGGTPQINSSDEGGAKPEKICRMDWCPDSPRGVQFLFLAIFLWMRCVLIWI